MKTATKTLKYSAFENYVLICECWWKLSFRKPRITRQLPDTSSLLSFLRPAYPVQYEMTMSHFAGKIYYLFPGVVNSFRFTAEGPGFIS